MIQNVLKRTTCGIPSANSSTFLSFLRNVQQVKTVVLFLDYDGTLTPIVERPDQAFLSNDTRQAIRCLTEHFKIAIISGRTRKDVKSRVDIPDIFYAGSHGFDISGPCGIKSDEHHPFNSSELTKTATSTIVEQLPMVVNQQQDLSNSSWIIETDSSPSSLIGGQQQFITFQVANNYVPILNQLYEKLSQELGKIKGCILENNIFSLSVHYRLIESQLMISKIEEIIHSLVNEQQGMVKVTHGKKVFEIRVNLDWHKGKAIMKLLEYWNLTSPEKVFAIYVGDDRTDEDGFKYLSDHSLGVGILVSPQSEERPPILVQPNISGNSSNNLSSSSTTTATTATTGHALSPSSTTTTTTFAKYSLNDTTDVLSFLNNLSKLVVQQQQQPGLTSTNTNQ